MRKTLAIAALAGSMAVTALAVAPAAQAATQTSTTTTTSTATIVKWGKFFSSDRKAYTYTCWAGKFDNCGKKYRIF